METESSGEKVVHVMRDIRGKMRFTGILTLGEGGGHKKTAFRICFFHRKTKSQFLPGNKQQLK